MSDDTLEMLAPGAVFHRYAIVQPLGAGGMATVYEAAPAHGGAHVALKVMHPGLARNAAARARFLREGEAASRIRHPHVVDVSEVGTHDGLPYMVMELLEGQDLASYLQCAPALATEHVAALILPVLAAVEAVHRAGVVHRDLKPGNVFLARALDGATRPVVLDFGVSRIVAGAPARVLTGGGETWLLGTPYYMAPEQAAGDGRTADARSDQYALGVLLYECVAGRGPFEDDGMYGTLHAIVQGAFAAPSVHRPGLPRQLEAVVLRAMARDPHARFRSVLELGRALLPFASLADQVAWEETFGRPTMPFGARSESGTVVAASGEPLPASESANARDADARARWLRMPWLAAIG